MTLKFNDNSQSIGNTPLIKINNISDGNIWVKIESRNPANSVKCRIGANMVWQAEKSGALKKGMSIIEATSGNTGIALAFVAAAKGYPLTITMPDTMSIERRQLITALGATIVLTEGAKGMPGAIAKADELQAVSPGKYFAAKQFENPANPAIHESTTGPEIWQDSEGAIDILVSGVGTGGTLTGVSRYIKNTQGKAIVSVAIEPMSSTVIAAAKSGAAPTHGPHKVQGIGAGFVPKNLDLDMVDLVEQVGDDEAMQWAHKLMQQEGILAGISSGAAMAVAHRLSQRAENKGKMIVAILPDSGERYLSTALFAGDYAQQ